MTNPTQLTTHYPLSIQRLIRTLSTLSSLTPDQLKLVIEESAISEYDLFPWADFNHSPHDSYGRNMVYHGGHFEIMVMSWLPGDFSAIHDHGQTQWGAVQCFGEAEHYVYTLEQTATQAILKNQTPAHYQCGDIRTVNHDTIHQMGNRGDRPLLSLHVYGCAQTENSPAEPAITGDARIFDLLENSIQFTDGGVFFYLPENKIKRRQYGISGDIATRTLQYELMRDRLKTILSADPLSKPYIQQKLAQIERRIQHETAIAQSLHSQLYSDIS